jgi:hypothetical protein
VADPARTPEFCGAVLGWRWQPGRRPGGWQVEGTTPLIGVSGGHEAAAAVPVWQVTDVAAAVAQVRAAGGTSTEPRARFEAVARGYRSWALAQPHRYRLLFGPPLPGYDAHAQRLVAASEAASMDLLLGVLRQLGNRTPLRPPSHLPPSSRRGRTRTPSTLTRRSPCTPSSSGAACTAWSAWKSPATSHPWASTRARSSRPSFRR